MSTAADLRESLKQDAADLASELTGWRRDLHRHPELGFELPWTSAYVRERLEGFGLEIHTGIAQTGIAAVLRSGRGQGQPAVLLRADMDALPIQEVEGREYGSQIDGRMHACGHDGHTAMLLGAVRLLAARRDELPRDVVFCFQPAEEGGGGAKVMIDEGLLDIADIGSVYGLHLWSGHATGTIQVRPGPAMAATDEFQTTIRGEGGHGAMPNQTRDPIVAAAGVVQALQSIVSRNVDPVDPAVVTVGSLHAGSAHNVIPETATMIGTMRSFTNETRELLRRRVPEVTRGVAEAFGCTANVELNFGYPATVNDVEAAADAARIAKEVVGEAGVMTPPPIAGGEDFSYFLEERPGAFVFVGSRDESRGITAPHHAPDFDIDEAALPRGTELLCRLAIDAR